MRYELTAYLVSRDGPKKEFVVLRCRHTADTELDARRLALEQAHSTGMFIVSFIRIVQLKPQGEES